MGCGVCFFSLRIGLESRFVVFFLLVGLWGVFGRTPLFLFWMVSFLGLLGISSFLSFSSLLLWGSRSARSGGWLDGVFLFSPFSIHCISWLDIPDFVHFVFDGPLHCRKVEQRFQTS